MRALFLLSLIALAVGAAPRSPVTNNAEWQNGRPVALTRVTRPKVESAFPYRPETHWTYSHHPSITFFKDRFFAIWSNSRKDEDTPGQRVLVATSKDFVNWTEPRPLVDSVTDSNGVERVLTAAGFHQYGGVLVAYVGNYGPHKETTHLQAVTTTDGEHWSGVREMGVPVNPNHGPQRTASGRLIIAGNISFPYTDDPSGLSGWRMTGIYPASMAATIKDDPASFWEVAKQQGWSAALCEGSFYQTDDGVIHMPLRNTASQSAHRLWLTESRDQGATWSTPIETEFSDTDAKFHFGRLPDGRFYYVGNPIGGGRTPLVLSLSRDGVSFDHHYILGETPYQRRRVGAAKGGEYGYPHTLICEGYLYVIVSRQKEAVEVLRVGLNQLNEKPAVETRPRADGPLPKDELTVRVLPTRGGPQIHVNGKPIVPRFFWGAMNGGSLRLGEEWSEQSFEFCPGIDVQQQGTLHLRFGSLAGKIDLADLRIRDTQTGEDILPLDSFAQPAVFTRTWNTWPPPAANTVAKWEVADRALHVTLVNPTNGPWPDFHFHSTAKLSFRADRTYRCSFRAKASPPRTIQPALYQVANGAWNNIGGSPGPFLSQVALARDAGVNLVSFTAPECWSPPENPVDWSPLDSLCRRIIAVNSNVLLVPRVGADAPGWWLDRHPQSRMVYDRDKVRADHASVSDRTYRADAAAHLEKLCRHLCEAFPRHFAGIHPCGQNTGEWFYQDSWERPLSGYDHATVTAFRDWLKARGRPDSETATVPTDTERRAHPFGFLRDPAREQRLIDFARFQQAEMADHVAALAAACRRGTAGQKLVVFFYGYLFEFGALANGAPTSGHYALSRLLGGKDIDILCSPISYTDREWLGTAPCMSAAESVREAGILWLSEDDSRTFLDLRTAEHVQEGGLVDLEQTRQVMLRNTAQEALRGFGSWWMDLPAQGWFNDARIWEEMVRLRPVDDAMLRRSRPFTPDVAMITDEDSMCHLTGGSAVAAQPLTYNVRADFGRMGAPYGQYLLADVLAGKVFAKLQVFVSAWALSSDQRRTLVASRPPGITRVWCWAPGLIYSDRQDVTGIADVTGFKARAVSLPSAAVTPTDEGRRRGLLTGFGPKAAIQPLFAIEARPEETWAAYADGSAAVAARRRAGKDPSVVDPGWDVFVGTPRLTPELLRALAKLTDLHLFTEANVPVWAAEGYIAIQAHAPGPITVDVGQAVPVFDALDNQPLGRGPRVQVPFKQGETRLMRY